MELVIDGDVLFLLNYGMDLLLLFMTAQMSRIPLRMGRITLATLWMAVYGTVAFTPEFQAIASVAGRVAVGGTAVWILGPSGGFRGFLKGCLVLAVVSVGSGGLILALILGTDLGYTLQAVATQGGIYIPASPWILLTGIGAMYGLMLGFRWICVRNFSRDRLLTEFVFSLGDRLYRVTALHDTGCELTVPVTGEGVLLISEHVLQGADVPEELRIPLHTVGGRGEVSGFYPKTIRCLSTGYQLAQRPVIGVVKGDITGDGLYQGIYNPIIIERKTERGRGAGNGGRGHHEMEDENIHTEAVAGMQPAMGDSASQGNTLHRGE